MIQHLAELDRVQVLFPEYDIVDRHDGGSQASVYMASHITTDRTVAIKILTQGVLASPAYRQRFFNEIDMISQLDHDNIVTLYNFGEAGGCPYYIMQHVLGMPVADHVFLHEYNVRRCVELWLKICDAIGFANVHGIIHRDIKPTNIIVNTEHKPYVLDFGLGKLLSDRERHEQLFATQPFHIVGTVPYMSPEQAGGEHVDARSDQYALAVLLYEMITDELPYELSGSREQALHTIADAEPVPMRRHLGPRDRCKPSEVHRDLQAVMSKALRKDPDERYESVAEMAEDAGRWLRGEVVHARSGNVLYVMRKTARRHSWPVVMVLSLMLLGAAFWLRSERIRQGYQATLQIAGINQLAASARDLDRADDALALLQGAAGMGQDFILAGDGSAELLKTYIHTVQVHLGHNELELAGVSLAKVMDLASDIRSATPNDDGTLRNYGLALRLQARLHAEKKENRQALAVLRQLESLREGLVTRNPNNTTIRRELITVLSEQGKCYAKLGDSRLSKRYHDRALTMRQEMFKDDPSTDNAFSLAYCRLHVANWHIVQDSDQDYQNAEQQLTMLSDIISEPRMSEVRPRDVRRLSDAVQKNRNAIRKRQSKDG